MMASKNCPHCQKQVPVACKRCTCGHVFFASRRGAASNSREISSSSVGDLPAMESVDQLDHGGDPSLLQPTRRSGRVVRERPQFYDALEYENQTRRQKVLLRKQSKPTKYDEQEDNPGSDEGSQRSSISSHYGPNEKSLLVGRVKDSIKLVGTEPTAQKRRRGRPPGLTNRNKPNQGYKIHIKAVPNPNTKKLGGPNGKPGDPQGGDKGPEDRSETEEDIMAGITPEKALQYNIVLQDINRKISKASWTTD